MDVKFGTSGLRGPGRDLLSGAAYRHVLAFCEMLAQDGFCRAGETIHLARDLRDSSPALAGHAAAAIRAAGFAANDCGTAPTPALAHHAFAQGNAAIMITGSHIPADRNGVKFYLPGAEIAKAHEREIVRRLTQALPPADAEEPAHGAGEAAAMARWRERYRGLLADDAFSGMRIGVYEHSSIATDSLAQILEGFGAQIIRFGRSARFVPVDTEAVGEAAATLFRREAGARGLDAIVSTDADGDRPLLADETGAVLPGDLLGWATALWLDADALATPVTSNSAIRSVRGRAVTRTRVGSPHVIEAIEAARSQQARCAVGFEANGGFLLGSDVRIGEKAVSALPTRDSVLPLLGALRHARSNGLALGGLREALGFRATAADRLQDYAPARSGELMRRLREQKGFADRFLAGIGGPGGGGPGGIVALDATDGLRFELDGGSIVHFRPSGNAPEMRCYCEAPSAAAAQALLAAGMARLADFEA